MFIRLHYSVSHSRKTVKHCKHEHKVRLQTDFYDYDATQTKFSHDDSFIECDGRN
jgi:hypothetical protein